MRYVAFAMKRSSLFALSLFLVIPACGDGADADGSSEAGTGDASSGDGDGDADTSGSSAETSAETSGTDTGTDTSGGFEPVPAKGITITEVTASQGTRVPIGQNGQWVDGNGRNTRLIRGRDTLIRVHHVLEDGWVPRVIEARLTIILPGGEEQIQTQQLEIQSDSNPRFLDRGFYFGLQEAMGQVEEGVQYQIELFDITPAGEGLSDGITVTPPQPELIGFENVKMEMKVMYVPFNYTVKGTTPDLSSEEVRKTLNDTMYQQQPIQTLYPDYHAPVAYNQTLSNLGNLLSAVDQVRSQDGAPSNIYYAGVIDTGAQSGVVGIAPLGGNISANLWRTSKSSTAETIVHEVGHNQGLNHVECPGGNSAGNDSSYPDHPQGRIMNTGFGIRNFQVYGPETTLDYMTYCGPVWVSDWTWNKVWNRISQFTAQGDVGLPQTPVLRHAIYEDGSEEWWNSLTVLSNDELSANTEVEFVRDGVVVATTLAKREVLSDDSTIWITAPLPAGETIDSFDLVRETNLGQTREVGIEGIKVIKTRATADTQD